MFSKYIMALLVGAFVGCLDCAYAQAQEIESNDACSGEITIGIQTRDPRTEFGVDFSNGKSVAKLTLAGTCGHFAVIFRDSMSLSDQSGYGGRRTANTRSFEGSFRFTVNTPGLGPLDLKFCAGYMSYQFRRRDTTADDYVKLCAEISRTYAVSPSWTITPRVSTLKYVPVGRNNPLYWIIAEADAEGQLRNGVTLHITLGDSRNINSITAVPQGEVRFGEVAVEKKLRDGLSATIGVRYVDPLKKSIRVDQHIEFDGKLAQRHVPAVRWVDESAVTFFVKATISF